MESITVRERFRPANEVNDRLAQGELFLPRLSERLGRDKHNTAMSADCTGLLPGPASGLVTHGLFLVNLRHTGRT
jgi:hypothetical protein